MLNNFKTGSKLCYNSLITKNFQNKCYRSISISSDDKWSQYDQQWYKSFTNNDPSKATGDEHIKEILENNRKWVKKQIEKDTLFFDRLGEPQKPRYLYFGCSDSRVPANEILGMGPGQVFIHRNVGNLVPGNDLNALSVLEYAVTHLDVTDIIVTGHYDCGAIRAATRTQDLGLLENWLRSIRDVYRIHKDYLDMIEDDEQKHFKLVELNVVEQCLNLYKTGVIQRKRHRIREQLMREFIDKGEIKTDDGNILKITNNNKILSEKELERLEEEVYPRIHGLVFNPKDGLLQKLTVNFSKRVGSLDHIYGLYKK